MNILLGTTSKDKENILINYLKEINFEDFTIKKCNISSGVEEQPLNELAVLTGANNRASEALKFGGLNDIGIGLEGGLTTIPENNDYYLICAAVIKDCFGNTFTGISEKIILPKKISNLIRENKDFGTIIREEASNYINFKDYEELISRQASFKQAIHKAFLVYFNEKIA